MITTGLLTETFFIKLEETALKKNLTDQEKERIIMVFKKALANPYMNENQIYPKLTGREPV